MTAKVVGKSKDCKSQSRQIGSSAVATTNCHIDRVSNTFHHNVYVVLLDKAVWNERRVRAANPNRNPSKRCLYIGMTGISPEERFQKHKAGYKASYFVKKYGVRLLPEMYEHLNPMPFDAACQMEKELAEELRAEGNTVCGGV